uniref:CSON005104 protein n=1 Tax=Culicoides sonorensis TaxID=179676 RepID=A0A336MUV7_CULSO
MILSKDNVQSIIGIRHNNNNNIINNNNFIIESKYLKSEQIMREKQVSGRVQVQVWYHGERNELVVSLMAADDLAPRDDMLGYGPYPEAYAKIRILPRVGDGHPIQTEVSPPTQSPIWNATLTFTGIMEDNLMDRFVEIQLWDFLPQMEHVFLGEANVDISKAFLSDNASWYRLEDPKGLRGACLGKSSNASPRGSLANADVGRLIRRSDFGIQRSISDDVDSIGDATSLLHPDTAWFGGSRRGSSQSEQLEVEVYQLNKDFSRSLPGSRRSSFQNAEDGARSGEATPPVTYVPSRRRSSIAIRNKDPEEILRSLKRELGRTMSMEKPEKKLTSRMKLGPGQIQPKGYRLSSMRYGQLKLGFVMNKGMFEVEVIQARNIVPPTADPPDTYVKCYVKDGERLRHKKKTRVVRNSLEPIYSQTLKYSGGDIFGRSIVIMVWQRGTGFDHNQGLGGAEMYFDTIKLKQYTGGWYPLFPMHSLGSDSNDSP